VPVVPIAPQAAAPPEHPIHRPRDPRGEPLDAAPERTPVVRLDDHVDVILLHAEVVHAKRAVALQEARELPVDRAERTLRPQ
jgi:hypothetical protein